MILYYILTATFITEVFAKSESSPACQNQGLGLIILFHGVLYELNLKTKICLANVQVTSTPIIIACHNGQFV